MDFWKKPFVISGGVWGLIAAILGYQVYEWQFWLIMAGWIVLGSWVEHKAERRETRHR